MITHVLAVVPVSDLAVAQPFYERLFGRAPDNHPMESLIEWQLADHGWVQVTVDPGHAGGAALNLAVDDLSAHLHELAGRGVAVPEIRPVNKGVELAAVPDPDGNAITFIGNFRVDY